MLLKRLSVFSFVFGMLFSPLCWAGEHVELKGKFGVLTIDPATLAVTLMPAGRSEKIELARGDHCFDHVEAFKTDKAGASWTYPRLQIRITVATDGQGLKFLFTSDKEQRFRWPIAGLSPQAIALIIPDGEGLYVPNRDPFWLKEFSRYPALSLSMPFWAVYYSQYAMSTLMAEYDIDTDVQIKQNKGQLYLVNTHRFLKRDHFPAYEIRLHLTDSSPISPAIDYQRFLIEKNKFVSLRQKILENANVNKLLGAFHVWVWGDGKTLDMLYAFDRLGVKHLWIGYDANPVHNGFNIDKTYVRLAKKRGYLIAPYDSFHNAQNPRFSDSVTSVWPHHLWPEGCIHALNGSFLSGFSNRGCYLSAEALRIRETREKNIVHHVDVMTDKGDNSLFLDCDAASPLYDDYSTQHPMTRLQDLKDRIERMRYISSTRKLVLGSETGLAWSSPVMAYNNGGFLSFSQVFWPCLKDKQFGAWWPRTRPAVLFKPYRVSREFIHASYDPRYRLPLYEAVFHHAVVSTDRWELNELKIPAMMQTKALLQNLYNIPPIWVLDQQALKENEDYFTAYYQFFSPLHQMAGLEALTHFAWLSKDHLIQQTQFGNRLILTANFSKQAQEGIGAGCIQAQWKEDGSKNLFCPKKYYRVHPN